MAEKKDNNMTWRPKSRFKSRQPSKNTRKRYKCKQEGHIRRFCPKRTQKKEDLAQSDKGDASVVSNSYESADVLVAS